MKKIIGLVAVSAAIGMVFMLFINRFIGLVIIILLLLIGYHFFYCE